MTNKTMLGATAPDYSQAPILSLLNCMHAVSGTITAVTTSSKRAQTHCGQTREESCVQTSPDDQEYRCRGVLGRSSTSSLYNHLAKKPGAIVGQARLLGSTSQLTAPNLHNLWQ